MNSRTNRGASLAFVAAVSVIIVVVGLAIFFLMQLFGGFRELQNATDAGNLNVAKQALKTPNFVPVSNYQLDFAGLVDGINGMDLQAYNRCVGQAFLVAMNAMADRPQGNPNGSPSAQGLQDAMIVCQAANGGDPNNSQNVGIGQSLYRQFTTTDTNALFSTFGSVADSDSERMLGANAQVQPNGASFDTAFMQPGGATNVWLDSTILPYIGDSAAQLSAPSSALSSQQNSGGNPYLAGYTSMQLGAGAASFPLVGVPVFPNSQPHLVAGRDFVAAKSSNDVAFSGVVPPNAYKSASYSSDQSSANLAAMEAYAITGVLNNDYPVSIPQGYIEINNPPGITATPTYQYDNIFTDELMTGIYLGTDNQGGTAFSTDPNAIAQWVAHNSNPAQNPQPPLLDPNTGQPLVYDDWGNPPTSIVSTGVTQSGGRAGNCPCMWYDCTGPLATSPCQDLLYSFMQAYPNGPAAPSPPQPPMTAVETLKYNVFSAFYAPSSSPATAAWLSPTIDAPTSSTGLRYWQSLNGQGWEVTHGGIASPIPPYSPVEISVPGTMVQLVQEAVPTSQASIFRQVVQRMREIDPTTSADWATNWLTSNSQTIDLGTTYYIFKTNAGWQLTTSSPPGKHQVMNASGNLVDVQPDGSLQQYLSDPIDPVTGIGGYQTITTMVDCLDDGGVWEMFCTTPPPSSVSRGLDVVDWQPSSGYGNLLGVLTFRNYCGGPLTGNTPYGGTYGTRN